MKRQLRPEDMLARLGGDEFAVLVPVVQTGPMWRRLPCALKSCFDDPFWVEGYMVTGSASIGIALYPADATTRDGLLTTADSAMYAEKNVGKRQVETPAERTQLGHDARVQDTEDLKELPISIVRAAGIIETQGRTDICAHFSR